MCIRDRAAPAPQTGHPYGAAQRVRAGKQHVLRAGEERRKAGVLQIFPRGNDGIAARLALRVQKLAATALHGMIIRHHRAAAVGAHGKDKCVRKFSKARVATFQPCLLYTSRRGKAAVARPFLRFL